MSPTPVAPHITLREPRGGPTTGSVPVSAVSAPGPQLESVVPVTTFINGLVERRTDVVVFQAGESIAELVRIAKASGRSFGLFYGLRIVMKVCSCPEPAAALKALGIATDIVVRQDQGATGPAHGLSGLSLEGSTVAVVHHGERNMELVNSLAQHCRSITELLLC